MSRMLDRMNMSLDQILNEKQKNNESRNNNRNRSMGVRGGDSNRNRDRNIGNHPYDYSRVNTASRDKEKISAQIRKRFDCAIKILLPNNLTGVLIGAGGSSRKELTEICGANVQISGNQNLFPGSDDRVVYITGSEEAVTLAQSLVWEMIGQQTQASNEGRTVVWFPRESKESPGRYDEVQVTGKIAVPASAGGIIIGKGGSSLEQLARENGIKLSISSREEGETTDERVLTMTGSVGGCMNCTFQVLAKLKALEDKYYYTYNDANYPNNSGSRTNNNRSSENAPQKSSGPGIPRQVEVTMLHPRGGSGGSGIAIESKVVKTISAHTTIEIAVPDKIVGAIIGAQGTTLKEITEMSGASIEVSKRGEFVPGTSNRLVTIVGDPAEAQTAHILLIHRLRQYEM